MRLPARFLHSYYVGNLLVIASYALLRRHLADAAATEGPHAKLATYVRAASRDCAHARTARVISGSRCGAGACAHVWRRR